MNSRTNSMDGCYSSVLLLLSIYSALGLLSSGTTADGQVGSILNTPGTLFVFPNSGGSFGYCVNMVDFLGIDQSILQPFSRLVANLMVPPENSSHLCEFPVTLLDRGGDGTAGVEFSFSPIALLVRLGGGCDVVTKIKVALEIRELVSNDLLSVLFYDENQDAALDKVPLEEGDARYFPANFSRDSIEGFESMVFATLNSASGESILKRMMDEKEYGSSPELIVGQNNADCRFLMSIERGKIGYGSGYDNVNNTSGSLGFKIFLCVFFALCPIVQFIRFWYDSGGRILLRRNDNGRPIGFHYIAPDRGRLRLISLSNNRDTSSGDPIHDRLTEEEVKALPEIRYKDPMEPVDSERDPDTNATKGTSNFATNGIVSGCSACNHVSGVNKVDIPTGSDIVPSSVENRDQEDGTTTRTNTGRTTSTACSICIEEFVDGESIRLLPCGHGFHTECILPWLTERQGCCPLCKAKVISKDVGSTTNQIDNNIASERTRD